MIRKKKREIFYSRISREKYILFPKYFYFEYNLFSKDSKIQASMIRKKEKFYSRIFTPNSRKIYFERFQNSRIL